MTSRQKLIDRICALPPEATFEDVKRLIEMFGWKERKGSGGSHHAFRKKGHPPIFVPKKGGQMVKRGYLRELCELLGLDVNTKSGDDVANT